MTAGGTGPLAASLQRVLAGERTRPLLSVELFPPRSRDREGFERQVRHLLRCGLDFASVTYGAAGSTPEATAEAVAAVARAAREQAADGAPPTAGRRAAVVAHLTCVAHGPAEVTRIAGQLLQAGADGFLALHGDPPTDPGWSPPPDAVHTCAELVGLLRELPGRGPEPFDVAVAAFPGGHPDSTGPVQDLAALRAKREAGAGFALTQVVFSADEHAALRDRAEAAGLDLPLVPGVLPLTDPARVLRVARLAGVEPPASALTALSGFGEDRAARHRLGVQLTARLCQDLLDAGAPGLHLYSMNRHEAVVDVLDTLDLLPVPACSCSGERS